jgi:hypothetical protein
MADMPCAKSRAYSLSMNPAMQHPSDRPATAAPREQAGPTPGRDDRQSPAVASRHDVMKALLGTNDLAAFDAYGGDPYNATGRHLRR